MLPVGTVTRETIGRSENGLRVEISLKYRRLLVQKLAKESLLSAKDHESFRLAQFARAFLYRIVVGASVLVNLLSSGWQVCEQH